MANSRNKSKHGAQGKRAQKAANPVNPDAADISDEDRKRIDSSRAPNIDSDRELEVARQRTAIPDEDKEVDDMGDLRGADQPRSEGDSKRTEQDL